MGIILIVVLNKYKISNINPLYIPIVHEIARNSNAGMGINVVNRFSNVQSLVKLAQAGTSDDIYLTVMDSDNTLCHRLALQVGLSEKELASKNLQIGRLQAYLESSDCPYTIAYNMRKDSWGVDILGVTHTPLYH